MAEAEKQGEVSAVAAPTRTSEGEITEATTATAVSDAPEDNGSHEDRAASQPQERDGGSPQESPRCERQAPAGMPPSPTQLARASENKREDDAAVTGDCGAGGEGDDGATSSTAATGEPVQVEPAGDKQAAIEPAATEPAPAETAAAVTASAEPADKDAHPTGAAAPAAPARKGGPPPKDDGMQVLHHHHHYHHTYGRGHASPAGGASPLRPAGDYSAAQYAAAKHRGKAQGERSPGHVVMQAPAAASPEFPLPLNPYPMPPPLPTNLSLSPLSIRPGPPPAGMESAAAAGWVPVPSGAVASCPQSPVASAMLGAHGGHPLDGGHHSPFSMPVRNGYGAAHSPDDHIALEASFRRMDVQSPADFSPPAVMARSLPSHYTHHARAAGPFSLVDTGGQGGNGGGGLGWIAQPAPAYSPGSGSLMPPYGMPLYPAYASAPSTAPAAWEIPAIPVAPLMTWDQYYWATTVGSTAPVPLAPGALAHASSPRTHASRSVLLMGSLPGCAPMPAYGELLAIAQKFGSVRSLQADGVCATVHFHDLRSAREALREWQQPRAAGGAWWPAQAQYTVIDGSHPPALLAQGDDWQNQGTLVVFNLDAAVSNADLHTAFASYGEIKEVRETPSKWQHKFVEFFDVRDAAKALSAMDGQVLGGKKLKIEFSRPGGARRVAASFADWRTQQHNPGSGLQGLPMAPYHNPSDIAMSSPTAAMVPNSPFLWAGGYGAYSPASPLAMSPPVHAAVVGAQPPHYPTPPPQPPPPPPLPTLPQPPAPTSGFVSALAPPKVDALSSGGRLAPRFAGAAAAVQAASASLPTLAPDRKLQPSPKPAATASPSATSAALDIPLKASNERGSVECAVGGSPPLGAASGVAPPPPAVAAAAAAAMSPAAATDLAATADCANSNSSSPRPLLSLDALVGDSCADASRTTVMIKNIPNKYSQGMLLSLLDAHCRSVNAALPEDDADKRSAYDFTYLPIDFKNRCNLGYAFVNFTTPEACIRFYQALHKQPWEAFNSRKICEITYARLQGRDELEEHFKNSRFACDTEEYLPLIFSPPRDGSSSVASFSAANFSGARGGSLPSVGMAHAKAAPLRKTQSSTAAALPSSCVAAAATTGVES